MATFWFALALAKAVFLDWLDKHFPARDAEAYFGTEETVTAFEKVQDERTTEDQD